MPERATLLRVLAEPIKAIILVFAIDLALRSLPLDEDAQAWADRVVRSLIAASIFWALSRLAGAARTHFTTLADMLTPAAVDWLVKALHALFFAVGAAAVLEIWGVEVAPLLAGLGIFGVAIALGAQDLFKNLIAGLAVLAEKRFSVGDWISVEGVVEGTVEKINFRSTLIRRFDLSPVYVPNAQLADNPVVNFSRMTHRRISWTIGLEYGVALPQLKSIRCEGAQRMPQK
ncbi:MAG: mechanosensitive ion channel family protein [Hyphomonadaceae bacterium]